MASSECRLLSVLEATVTQLRTRFVECVGEVAPRLAMEIFELETITIGRTNRSLSLHFLQSKVENLVYNVQMPLWIGSSSLDIWNVVVNVETWVSASGNNGLQHDWLICIAKIGQTLTRATRDFHPSAFSLLSHPSSFHRDSQFSTHKEMTKTIEEQAKKIEEQDNRLQVVEDFIKFMKEQPSFSLTPSNDPALFDSQSQ
ncbi:hypothetical protein WN944_000946 [Citrus x changshan-huyou]|uniref:Uncharacterized protein n=1 Tax=Citrus x changshan-huyou TaxID=2935761 RepID=A0AAP0QUB4_9ROSI